MLQSKARKALEDNSIEYKMQKNMLGLCILLTNAQAISAQSSFAYFENVDARLCFGSGL